MLFYFIKKAEFYLIKENKKKVFEYPPRSITPQSSGWWISQVHYINWSEEWGIKISIQYINIFYPTSIMPASLKIDTRKPCIICERLRYYENDVTCVFINSTMYFCLQFKI